VLTHM